MSFKDNNSFKPSMLKKTHAPRADNKFLAYVEDLVRKRYYKVIEAQFSVEQGTMILVYLLFMRFLCYKNRL